MISILSSTLPQNPKESYEIDLYDMLFCKLVRLVKKKHKIPKIIKKYSNKKYGRRANLLRYYIKENMGITIGKYSYGFEPLCIPDLLESIGSFCSIGPGVEITVGNHPTDCVTSSPIICSKEFGFLQKDNYNLIQKITKRKIIIGNDVWIGQNVTLLQGIKIGDGAVIGAGAVVTKDIPDYAIVIGVPARIIKYRFPSIVIESLKKIKWWTWTDKKIYDNISHMTDINAFVKIFDNN